MFWNSKLKAEVAALWAKQAELEALHGVYWSCCCGYKRVPNCRKAFKRHKKRGRKLGSKNRTSVMTLN